MDPTVVGVWPAGSGQEVVDIAVSGNYAYLACGQAGLQIIDISSPNQPRSLGGVVSGGYANRVIVSELRAYVANRTNGLELIDVSSPALPKRLAVADTTQGAIAAAMSGNLVCVLRGWAEPAWSWTMEDRLLGGMQVVDLRDPASPKAVGTWGPAPYWFNSCSVGSGFNPKSVVVVGNFAYVADATRGDYVMCVSSEGWGRFGGGLHVIDISAPGRPTTVEQAYTGRNTVDLAVSGHSLYILESVTFNDAYDRLELPGSPTWPGRLVVTDISSLTNAVRVASLDMVGDPSGVAAFASYVFVADRVNGLHVFDVSDATRPHRLGGNTRFPSHRVAVHKGMIFLAAGTNGLAILEMPLFIKSITRNASSLLVAWDTLSPVRLQQSTRLNDPDWVDLPDTEVTNRVALPTTGVSTFLRLRKL